jgi:hypothetical protein
VQGGFIGFKRYLLAFSSAAKVQNWYHMTTQIFEPNETLSAKMQLK